MEVIRLFCSSMDIEPRVLLNHVLRYLGFYAEEITGSTKPSKINSLADIYIISDYYMEDKADNLDIDDEEKAILICKDGWTVDDEELYNFDYVGTDDFDQDASQEENLNDFMSDLISYLSVILRTQHRQENLLYKSVENLREALDYVASKYVEFEILPATLFTRCFYSQEDLYLIAEEKYTNFINALNASPYCDSDLFRYIKTYAQFEFSSICQKNSIVSFYPMYEMSDICSDLLIKYPQNEQIRILQANIHFELDGAWAKAANEYGDVRLSHCSYAHYKQGRILRKYAKDYENALTIERWAAESKNDYFPAWYQIALCLEKQAKYEEAVSALEEVCKILNPKYLEHILAPVELEYLYKAVLMIAQISESYLGDYVTAQMYKKIADTLKKEVYQTRYLEAVWKNASESQTLLTIIQTKIQEKLDCACEKVQ